uniref:Dimer_Tnp_hAT domain-containing protein n=1 Tax=Panagrellus redivivus TaxID=6233 RepID=A0A7E4V6J6_PANRE
MEILATAINLMYSVSSFFRNSGKRHDILQEELRKYKSSTGSMKSQSRTRFIENHKIFDDFLDNIQPVVQALSRIATEDTSSRDSRAAAVGYLVDLIDKDFVVLLCILQITGKLMASHARRLQGIALDHATAKQAMLSVVQTFTDWKNGSGTGCADNVLKNIYQLLDDIIAVVDKRIASRFVSPLKEEIKLVDVTGPLGVYLEALSTELLLPDSINSAANKELESLFRQYSNSIFLDNDYEQFLMEVESYKPWINSISPSPPEPQTAYDYLSKDNSMLSKLISIYLTVPSNTATPERTFSWMRVIKNHLRNSMTDERLSAITVIYGNTLYPGIVDDIYNMFRKSQTRRLTH